MVIDCLIPKVNHYFNQSYNFDSLSEFREIRFYS